MWLWEIGAQTIQYLYKYLVESNKGLYQVLPEQLFQLSPKPLWLCTSIRTQYPLLTLHLAASITHSLLTFIILANEHSAQKLFGKQTLTVKRAWRIYSTLYCTLPLLLPYLITNLPYCLAMFIITLLYITATWLVPVILLY